MELHSNLYYTHPNTEIMQKLGRLFQEHRGEQDKFIAVAVELNSQLGQELAEDLLNTVDNIEFDLGPESLHTIAGYSVAHFVHGSSGDEFIEAILLFLKALLPEIHTLAWGCGDDDPWEFWFKFEGDELIREDDEPFNDPEQDDEIKSSIYTWWHTGLPEKIKEGFLKQA
ncbi:hypothetical protein [Acinetobacter guillouiae]|uniref:hypothetical protein n=1 Tax=Acinetobacter guillouiae TaxID=106649 RepID=UPI001AE3F876|nr:hypothetical protein [Acinetobacter guillouiae]MBP2543528.1 hypothetical protein [Acinetobacter guillouiae]